MKFHFILVSPGVPENIGASARAIKTMGFSDLRLVNPADHLSDPAKWLAHGSADILENARIFNTFEEAIADLDLTIATSSKKRNVRFDYYHPREVKNILQEKSDHIDTIGVVFGSEESGLSNHDLECCDIISTIPIFNPYPSLNLSQSVMIYAYELSSLIRDRANNAPLKEDDRYLIAELKKQSAKVLSASGIEKTHNLYNRIMERIVVSGRDDIHLMLSFCKNLLKKLQ